MAKKGKKGFRIPKEIGGIKVPKEARRAGEAIIDKVNSPEGRAKLSAGLAMAATAAAALAAKQAQDAATKKAAGDVPGEGDSRRPGQGGTADPHHVGDAIGQAATAFMAKFFQPR